MKGGRQKNKKRVSLWSKFYGVLFLSFVIFVVYFFRDGLSYYLGLKIANKNLNKKEVSDIRIYEVLSSHSNFAVGFDVSEYQGRIKWDKIGKIEDTFELSFVFIRATAGKNKVDKKFKRNWKGAKKSEILRGAYHYYRPNENSLLQADNFINTVDLEPNDFPPVLDIEKIPNTQSMDSLKLGLRRWLNKVEKHYKMKPIIYSGESYYKDFLKKEFADYPLWIANYNFWKKNPDKEWTIWQFTEKGHVEGIPEKIDVNLFNGEYVKIFTLLKK